MGLMSAKSTNSRARAILAKPRFSACARRHCCTVQHCFVQFFQQSASHYSRQCQALGNCASILSRTQQQPPTFHWNHFDSPLGQRFNLTTDWSMYLSLKCGGFALRYKASVGTTIDRFL